MGGTAFVCNECTQRQLQGNLKGERNEAVKWKWNEETAKQMIHVTEITSQIQVTDNEGGKRERRCMCVQVEGRETLRRHVKFQNFIFYNF